MGSLYRDQQAARRQARCDASRRRDGFGGLLAFTSHRGLDLAGLGEFCTGLAVGVGGAGGLGSGDHATWMGLSEPVVASLRCEPGRDIQQCQSRADDCLGHVAFWRRTYAGTRRGRSTYAGRHLLGQPRQTPVAGAPFLRLEPAARIESGARGLHPVAAVLTLSPEATAQ